MPESPPVKRMDIAEFRRDGYLQELNRLFLHPLGLALEVVVEDCDCGEGHVEKGPAGAIYSAPCGRCGGSGKREWLGGVWDYRDDPEGILFGEGMIETEKIATVEAQLDRHRPSRELLLGEGRFVQTADDLIGEGGSRD